MTDALEPRNGFKHVRKEDVRDGSAVDVDPPFASFDVVHRCDYEAIVDDRDALRGFAASFRLEWHREQARVAALRQEYEDACAEFEEAVVRAHRKGHGWKQVPFDDCPLLPCAAWHAREASDGHRAALAALSGVSEVMSA